MSIEFIQQNAKSIIEAIYEYDRTKDKKRKEQIGKYIQNLAQNIRKNVEKERALI